jgi:T-complex protein 1 subunit alpha
MDVLKDRLNMLISAGANVILTTKGIDDLANKYLVEAKILGLRRVPKEMLRKIARASGAHVVTSLANDEEQESFDKSFLGDAEVNNNN